jgi:hypothetical protein
MVAGIANRLLAGPERALAPTIPDLRDEPADRIADKLQALQQATGVAEPRSVPQHQRVAARLNQQIAGGDVGDVCGIAHLPHVLGKESANQRRLAGIGVRNQGEIYGCRRWFGIHAGIPAWA